MTTEIPVNVRETDDPDTVLESNEESSKGKEKAGHLFNTGLATIFAVTCIYEGRNLLFKA